MYYELVKQAASRYHMSHVLPTHVTSAVPETKEQCLQNLKNHVIGFPSPTIHHYTLRRAIKAQLD